MNGNLETSLHHWHTEPANFSEQTKHGEGVIISQFRTKVSQIVAKQQPTNEGLWTCLLKEKCKLESRKGALAQNMTKTTDSLSKVDTKKKILQKLNSGSDISWRQQWCEIESTFIYQQYPFTNSQIGLHRKTTSILSLKLYAIVTATHSALLALPGALMIEHE